MNLNLLTLCVFFRIIDKYWWSVDAKELFVTMTSQADPISPGIEDDIFLHFELWILTKINQENENRQRKWEGMLWESGRVREIDFVFINECVFQYLKANYWDRLQINYNLSVCFFVNMPWILWYFQLNLSPNVTIFKVKSRKFCHLLSVLCKNLPNVNEIVSLKLHKFHLQLA